MLLVCSSNSIYYNFTNDNFHDKVLKPVHTKTVYISLKMENITLASKRWCNSSSDGIKILAA